MAPNLIARDKLTFDETTAGPGVVTVTHRLKIRQAGKGQLLRRIVKRFRGGLAFKAHRLCVSPNSRLESNKEEEKKGLCLAAGFGALVVALGALGIGAIALGALASSPWSH